MLPCLSFLQVQLGLREGRGPDDLCKERKHRRSILPCASETHRYGFSAGAAL